MKSKHHWYLGGFTIVVTDTITTKLALDTQYFVELNRLMSSIMQHSGYAGLLVIKTLVVAVVYGAWYFDIGRDTKWNSKFDWLLPRFVSFVGVTITLWNSIQLLILYLFL
jgi:hypothetical protein